MACYAPIGDRVYAVVFVELSDAYRIISLRHTQPKEVRYYASQI